MIQILLLILKIIGITILVILGLLLLILALMLFVPMFYRVRIVHNPKETRVNGRVSFLFPLLNFTFQYLKTFSYKLRVLFFSVIDSEKTKKVKKKKQKKVKEQEKQTTSVAESSEKSPEDAGNSAEQEKVTGEVSVKPEPAERAEPEEKVEEKPGFFEKIRLKLNKIRETISSLLAKLKKLWHQKEEIQRILGEPSTKKALKFAWNELKHLLKHVLPRKIEGYVVYGAEDPATTGKVLGILSVIYAKTGQLLEIRPNFEEKQLECEVELRGHIQVFVLLVIAIKVFINPELRQLITEFKKVKEID